MSVSDWCAFGIDGLAALCVIVPLWMLYDHIRTCEWCREDLRAQGESFYESWSPTKLSLIGAAVASLWSTWQRLWGFMSGLVVVRCSVVGPGPLPGACRAGGPAAVLGQQPRGYAGAAMSVEDELGKTTEAIFLPETERRWQKEDIFSAYCRRFPPPPPTRRQKLAWWWRRQRERVGEALRWLAWKVDGHREMLEDDDW